MNLDTIKSLVREAHIAGQEQNGKPEKMQAEIYMREVLDFGKIRNAEFNDNELGVFLYSEIATISVLRDDNFSCSFDIHFKNMGAMITYSKTKNDEFWNEGSKSKIEKLRDELIRNWINSI